MEFIHTSVLLDECINGLSINPNGIYIDGTCGGGGHSYEIAKRLTNGTLIAIDQDIEAIESAKKRLKEFSSVKYINKNFSQINEILRELKIDKVDGILLDLGVSSYQLDNGERGFSYNYDAPLDMRMSQKGKSARDVVNEYSQNELEKILREYSEEKFSRRIAFEIIKAREIKPIETTFELNSIIKKGIPVKCAKNDSKNPSRRTYQALRIEVNNELGVLSQTLDEGFNCLNQNGRFCIITFHSLEDRIVKQRFIKFATGCTCPPEFPVCICDKKPVGKIITKKPITACEQELTDNKRSRSAKLRVIEKI